MFFKFVLLGLLITVLLFIIELLVKNKKIDYQNCKRYKEQEKERKAFKKQDKELEVK